MTMRRYPIRAPGLIRLTADGGEAIVDRLRGAMEPIVMAISHRFNPGQVLQAVSTDEMDTRQGEAFPREWWIRTAFVQADAPTTKEHAWLSIEYTRWETDEDWAMQAFFRLPGRSFSLSTDSSMESPMLSLLVEQMSEGDVAVLQQILSNHFGGAVEAGRSRITTDY